MPKQLEVLKALEDPKCKFILYSGAFRAGKTLLLANIAIRTCLENPGCVGFLGSLTYPQLRDVVFTVFKQEAQLYQKALDDAGIPITIIPKLISTAGNMRAEFYNGSVVHFKSCDDEMKIRGMTLDFFGLDEPIDIDETVFTQLVGRISGNVLKKPFGILTTNPGSENHWIYRRFFVESNDKYRMIKTTTYDNMLLPDYDNYIKSLQENFDDDWIKRFLDGDWGAFAGQIYKNFNPDKHIISAWEYEENKKTGDIERKGLKKDIAAKIKYFIAGVDFGVNNPTAILTIGITTAREAIIVDEWYQSGKTSRETVVKLKYLDSQFNYKKIYIDPSSLDLITQCEQSKLPVEAGINKVEPGIAKVKSLFKKDLILIDRKCFNTLREIPAYRYDRDRTNQNHTEKPIKFDDHACFDKDTEVLTTDGWKLFKDITYADKLATLNMDWNLEYQKPSNIIKKKSDTIIKSKYFAVTNDHKMLYSTQYQAKTGSKKLLMAPLNEIKTRAFWIPKVCNACTRATSYEAIDAYTLGFYLAEGCKSISRGRKYVHIDNTNIQYINKIHKIYGGCISTSVREKYLPIHRLSIKSDYLYDTLPFGLCDKKRIPRNFLQTASFEQLYDCFLGMVDGDGSVDSRGQITYNTTSKGLADDFQELLLLLGMNGSLYSTRKANKSKRQKECYRIYIYTDKSKYHQVIKSNHLKAEKYNDFVYCATVPNGTLCVRRHGRIIFCGNCDALRYALYTFKAWKLRSKFSTVPRPLWTLEKGGLI